MVLRLATRKFGSKLSPMCTSASFLHSHATSFGFKEVREEEKSQMVSNVFSSVASNYDLMNDLMSGGLHRLWKDRLVSKLNPFPGMKHLDVAGGTGDVAFKILETINNIKRRAMQDVSEDDFLEEGRIYVCDINPNMLNVGKKRALERGLGEDKSLVWVEGDAEDLSFDNNTMDGYTIAFGIRNVTHIEKVLAEAYRLNDKGGDTPLIGFGMEQGGDHGSLLANNVLAEDGGGCGYKVGNRLLFFELDVGGAGFEMEPDPEQIGILKRGGRFLCLELSHVEIPVFKELYNYYSFQVIPAIGELVAGDRGSYQYLVESIRRFPPQEKFASMIVEAGFQKVEYENLVGGVVSIHSGLKI